VAAPVVNKKAFLCLLLYVVVCAGFCTSFWVKNEKKMKKSETAAEFLRVHVFSLPLLLLLLLLLRLLPISNNTRFSVRRRLRCLQFRATRPNPSPWLT